MSEELITRIRNHAAAQARESQCAPASVAVISRAATGAATSILWILAGAATLCGCDPQSPVGDDRQSDNQVATRDGDELNAGLTSDSRGHPRRPEVGGLSATVRPSELHFDPHSGLLQIEIYIEAGESEVHVVNPGFVHCFTSRSSPAPISCTAGDETLTISFARIPYRSRETRTEQRNQPYSSTICVEPGSPCLINAAVRFPLHVGEPGESVEIPRKLEFKRVVIEFGIASMPFVEFCRREPMRAIPSEDETQNSWQQRIRTDVLPWPSERQ